MASYSEDAPACAMTCDGASSSPTRTTPTPTPAAAPEVCTAFRRQSLTLEKLLLLLD